MQSQCIHGWSRANIVFPIGIVYSCNSQYYLEKVKERYGKLVTHIRKYNVTRPLFQGAACIVNSLGVGYDHVPDVFSQNENLQDHTSEKYPFGWQRVFWSTRYTLIPPPHTVVIDAVTDAVLKIKHSGAMSAVHNTLFSTSFPSPDSIRLLPCAGIREVVYGGEKSIELPAMLQQCGINFR